MDFFLLFQKMNEKGYYYFEGNLPTGTEDVYLNFSTLYNGRGNIIDMRLNNHNKNDISIVGKKGSISMKHVSFDSILNIINAL